MTVDRCGSHDCRLIDWINPMLENLSGKIDGFEIHDYMLFKSNPVPIPQPSSIGISFNEFGQGEQVNIKTLDTSSYNLDEKTLSVTLPSKSIVMMQLEPPVSVQPGDVINNAVTTFTA